MAKKVEGYIKLQILPERQLQHRLLDQPLDSMELISYSLQRSLMRRQQIRVI